ncbi:MAG TPA: hypothetical protein VF190_10090 [Rhodothermales bacterium]
MSGLRTHLVGRLYASMAFFALAMALLDRFIDQPAAASLNRPR